MVNPWTKFGDLNNEEKPESTNSNRKQKLVVEGAKNNCGALEFALSPAKGSSDTAFKDTLHEL